MKQFLSVDYTGAGKTEWFHQFFQVPAGVSIQTAAGMLREIHERKGYRVQAIMAYYGDVTLAQLYGATKCPKGVTMELIFLRKGCLGN
jgi:hypothetical protein